MTTHDGTQERTLQPPDDTLSDAELRECERAARDGFDEFDENTRGWLKNELSETPVDLRLIARAAILRSTGAFPALAAEADVWVSTLRDRYIAECAADYWGDLIEQAKYAQEP
ncbi:MAG: hypothetical protein KGI71_04410 [Patescibacteria group bacterium]|nr:hypothetical protein [Patescibacteria group bacterium]